jgi:uncharacterized membrane protein YdbT with pleckstrin-like domain
MPENINSRLQTLALFAGLSEDDLDFVAEIAKQEHFEPEQVIFEQDDESDKFYVVESGQILLSVHDEAGAETTLTRMGRDEFFGEAGLLKKQARSATASAVGEVYAFSFVEGHFHAMLQRCPRVKARILEKTSERIEGEQPHYFWELDDETTLLVTRRHWISMLRVVPTALLAAVVCAALIFVAFAYMADLGPMEWIVTIPAVAVWPLLLLWYYIDWSNDFLIVTSHRVVHIERVAFLSETRTELPIEAVQNVELQHEGLLATWFHFAHVHISTAGGGVRGITFTYLPNAKAVQQQIVQQKREVETEKHQEEQAAIRHELEKVTRPPGTPLSAPSPSVRAIGSPIPTSAPRPSFWRRLGHIFQVRIEEEGRVIWRKHWFILLQQLAQPFVTIVVGVVLLALFALLHPWFAQTSWPVGLDPIAWLVIAIGVSRFVWEWADWGNDQYILTSDNIIDIERWPFGLRESRREGNLENIQDIQVQLPTAFSNLFNIGNVRIKTAATGGDFTFDHVVDPRGVQRDIFHQLARHRRQKELREREREFSTMAQWFSIYSQVASQTAHQPEPPAQAPR